MIFSRSKAAALAAVIVSMLAMGAHADQPSSLHDLSPHYGEDGWDIALGLGVGAVDKAFYVGDGSGRSGVVTVVGDVTYQKGRFYFAANDIDGLVAGITLARTDNWVFDATITPGFEGVDFGDNDQLKHLKNRKPDGLLGLRMSRYGDHSRLTLSAGKDVTGAHDGYDVTAEYFHEWQLKNWLLTGSAGVGYFSGKMVNHIVGVSEDEATAQFPVYQADAGYGARLALKAEYPLSEHWIFTSYAGAIGASSAFTDSPITRSGSDVLNFALVGLKYKF